MTGQSYMNSTTKFIKIDGQSVNKQNNNSPPSKQSPKKDLKEVKKPQNAVAPSSIPVKPQTQSSTLINSPQKPEKSPQKNAYNMTNESYLSSTTKYTKVGGVSSRGPGTYSPQKEKSQERSISQPKNRVQHQN